MKMAVTTRQVLKGAGGMGHRWHWSQTSGSGTLDGTVTHSQGAKPEAANFQGTSFFVSGPMQAQACPENKGNVLLPWETRVPAAASAPGVGPGFTPAAHSLILWPFHCLCMWAGRC